MIFLKSYFAYYDLSLPIGTDEIIKRLQMWLNIPSRQVLPYISGPDMENVPSKLSAAWVNFFGLGKFLV